MHPPYSSVVEKNRPQVSELLAPSMRERFVLWFREGLALRSDMPQVLQPHKNREIFQKSKARGPVVFRASSCFAHRASD